MKGNVCKTSYVNVDKVSSSIFIKYRFICNKHKNKSKKLSFLPQFETSLKVFKDSLSQHIICLGS